MKLLTPPRALLAAVPFLAVPQSALQVSASRGQHLVTEAREGVILNGATPQAQALLEWNVLAIKADVVPFSLMLGSFRRPTDGGSMKCSAHVLRLKMQAVFLPNQLQGAGNAIDCRQGGQFLADQEIAKESWEESFLDVWRYFVKIPDPKEFVRDMHSAAEISNMDWATLQPAFLCHDPVSCDRYYLKQLLYSLMAHAATGALCCDGLTESSEADTDAEPPRQRGPISDTEAAADSAQALLARELMERTIRIPETRRGSSSEGSTELPSSPERRATRREASRGRKVLRKGENGKAVAYTHKVRGRRFRRLRKNRFLPDPQKQRGVPLWELLGLDPEDVEPDFQGTPKHPDR
ncbi:unnamed protein product [Amoebophrya sp. A120]|nr:unnamed protein product [Amoebophrya sp. A120]|eukprot:GSA120T00016847001.1